MSYTIADLKNDTQRKLHGTTLDKLSGSIYDLAYEAARNILTKIDPKETQRITPLTNAVYNQVYSYSLPADIKGDKFISILPQTQISLRDNLSQVYGEHFELYKEQIKNISTVEYNSGTKLLKLAIQGGVSGKTINTLDSISSNGTWAVSGDASGLTVDTLNKYSGTGSLRFNLDDAGSAGVLTNSTMTAVDGSDEEDVGALFMPFYTASPSNITSVQLKWGSDASNHWKVTVTTTNEGLAFDNGWNLLRFDWASATETGTPDSSAIDYLEVTVTYDGTAVPNCRIDNVVLRLGEIYNIKYYSKYLFRDISGTWLASPTADSDIVNLDEDSYNILVYELAYLATQELQGEDGVFDRNFFADERDRAIREYTDSYRSEAIRPQTNYYRNLSRRRRRGSSNNR